MKAVLVFLAVIVALACSETIPLTLLPSTLEGVSLVSKNPISVQYHSTNGNSEMSVTDADGEEVVCSFNYTLSAENTSAVIHVNCERVTTTESSQTTTEAPSSSWRLAPFNTLLMALVLLPLLAASLLTRRGATPLLGVSLVFVIAAVLLAPVPTQTADSSLVHLQADVYLNLPNLRCMYLQGESGFLDCNGFSGSCQVSEDAVDDQAACLAAQIIHVSIQSNEVQGGGEQDCSEMRDIQFTASLYAESSLTSIVANFSLNEGVYLDPSEATVSWSSLSSGVDCTITGISIYCTIATLTEEITEIVFLYTDLAMCCWNDPTGTIGFMTASVNSASGPSASFDADTTIVIETETCAT